MSNNAATRNPDLGQVWTPRWVVDQILDEVGYTVGNPDLTTTVIMEPAFGSGAFLYPILDRLIAHCQGRGLEPAQIREVIANCVHGIEYDPVLYRQTLLELNSYLESEGIAAPAWQLLCQDALTYTAPGRYDIVVGNPPYIRVHDMTAPMRAAMKTFTHTGGTTDLYVAFFELGVNLLRPGGMLGYITPNSFLRNTSQRTFRAWLVNDGLLRQVEDFGARQIFDDAATYAAITVLSRPLVAPQQLLYHGYRSQHRFTAAVDYPVLRATAGDPLIFGNDAEQLFLTTIQKRNRALGELLAVQYGVATLRDKIYTNPAPDVEAALLRAVVKAPTYRGETVTQKILYPYRMSATRPTIIPETELAAQYPHGYAYLLANRIELEKRDRDRGSLWYAYGRSQGLVNIGREKLVLSHLIAPGQTRLRVYRLAAETVVYSGLFITAVPGGPDLYELQQLLQTVDVCRFLTIHGKDMAGGYKAFTGKTLLRYRV